jgi:hypothetical protein
VPCPFFDYSMFLHSNFSVNDHTLLYYGLSAPSALTVTAHETAQQILVEWTDNSDNEIGFMLERSSDGGSTWVDIVWVGANTTHYVDRDVIRGTSYHYRVRAYNND